MDINNVAYQVKTNKNFEQAVISVLKAVDAKSWSIFSIYDLQERLAAKGFQHKKIKIIEICSAKHSDKLLQKNQLISLCLPCKINVIEKNNGIYIVGMMPLMISELFPEVTKEDVMEAEKDVKEIVDNSKEKD